MQRIIAHASSSILRRAGRAGPEDPAAEEEDGLQLAVAASPHAQADGGGGGGEHGEPPHGVAREGARVEACEEEVEEVGCEGEVGDEFAARDEDDHGEGPVGIQELAFIPHGFFACNDVERDVTRTCKNLR